MLILPTVPMLPSSYSPSVVGEASAILWPTSFDDIAAESDDTHDWWSRLAAMSPTIVRHVYDVRVLPEEFWPWLAEYGGTDAPRHVYRERGHRWTCADFVAALVEALWPDLEPESEAVADCVRALNHIVDSRDVGLLTHLERSLATKW